MKTSRNPPTTNRLKVHVDPEVERSRRRRAAWRQWLVDTERGITQGFRADSSLFVHFFAGSIIVATAFVLGVGFFSWCLILLALAAVVSAELFHQAIKVLLTNGPPALIRSGQQTLKISTAAVFTATAGALAVIGLIFGRRLLEIFGTGG